MSDPTKYVIVSLKTDLAYSPAMDVPEYAAIPITKHDLEILLTKQNTISHLNLRYGAVEWEAVFFSDTKHVDWERTQLLLHADKGSYIVTSLDMSEDALIKAGAKVIETYETLLQVYGKYGPVYLAAELDDDANTPVLFNAFHLEEITFE